jgi:hypothetical protein
VELDSSLRIVGDFLHEKVGSTGISGFEGLVATLLREATGQEYRLSSAGRQSGGDAAPESGHAKRLKVEAKHYLKSTRLDLRELLSEIDQAAESGSDLDIWALATSRRVDEQMMRSLEAHAEKNGAEAIFLKEDLASFGRPYRALYIRASSLGFRTAGVPAGKRLTHPPDCPSTKCLDYLTRWLIICRHWLAQPRPASPYLKVNIMSVNYPRDEQPHQSAAK